MGIDRKFAARSWVNPGFVDVMVDTVVQDAMLFAARAHKEQRRKYTNDPYIVHPTAVAGMVAINGGTVGMVAAAYLHDTVEDTDVHIYDIYANFGKEIGSLVMWMTCGTGPRDGNRKARKRIDRDRLSYASNEVKAIKVADMIDNSASIIAHDPKFARVFMREMDDMMYVIRGSGYGELDRIADEVLDDYYGRTDDMVHK